MKLIDFICLITIITIVFLFAQMASKLKEITRPYPTINLNEFVPHSEHEKQMLATAIYKAEGSQLASRPYGIMLDKCTWENIEYCELALRQTIDNNIKRWKNSKEEISYLQFLANRYAPVEAHELNKNWLPNVSFFLKEALCQI